MMAMEVLLGMSESMSSVVEVGHKKDLTLMVRLQVTSQEGLSV